VAAVAVGGQHFLDELLARRADRTASSKSICTSWCRPADVIIEAGRAGPGLLR